MISHLSLFFCHINFRSFCKIKIQRFNFLVYKCTEFNKTIIPFAFVGYEIGYSQLGPTGLVGYSYPTRAHGKIVKYTPIFKTASVAKNIWRIIKTIVSIWLENMHGYLSLDGICSSMLTVFLGLRSRKTVRFSEQIMSADKYPCVFSCEMETIVYLLYGKVVLG